MSAPVNARKQDEAHRAEQHKAKELAEPEQPAEGLTVGKRRYTIEGHGLLNEQGIRTDAAGGYDHSDAAYRQYTQRVDDAEMTGGVDGEKADPRAKQVHAPDPGCINEKKRFVPYSPDAGQTMPDIQNDRSYLSHDADMSETGKGPYESGTDDRAYSDQDDDPAPRSLAAGIMEQRICFTRSEGMDDIMLEKEGQAENDQQADDVECTFCDDGSNQFIRRDFFITGQD